jgi:hypothetical protein
MSDDLKSFKISDATPRGQTRQPKSKGAEDPPAASVGFPSIEAQVEQDGPALPGLDERYDRLEALSKSGSNKEKAGAKKAMLAYERTHALLTHLLNTKAELSGAGGEQPEGEG